MKPLPTITKKQQEILQLLYRYRFLNRTQIQAFLHHKDRGRSCRWLKDLKSKQYIEWIYNPDDFTEKTKPAIFYLSLNGIRYLRNLDIYPLEELRKRYIEASRKTAFISRCLLIGDCGLNLETRSNGNIQYEYFLETDYMDPDNDYHFLAESEFVHPALCFMKKDNTQNDPITTSYLVDIFDSTTPHYSVRNKIKNYVNFLDSGEWTDETYDSVPPIVLIICPTKADLIYTKRYTKQLLQDIYDDDIDEDIRIRFSYVDRINELGVTGKLWEKI